MQRTAQTLFAVGLIGSVLALGALHTTVLAIDAAVFAVSAFFVWWGEKALRLRPAARALLLLAVALTAYTALQCLPLPAALVRAFAPANAAVWDVALAPLGAGPPAWMTISLDPFGTRVEVLRGVLYIAVFLAALRLARDRDGQFFLERLLVTGPVLIALAALIHPAFGARRVFGIYTPAYDVNVRHVAPLLNANHLAGYVNIGVCVALAAALSSRSFMPRSFAIGATVLLAGTETWVGSRGGVGSMLLGAVLVFLLVRRSRGTSREQVSSTIMVGGALAFVAVVLLVLGNSEAALSELRTGDLSKLQVFGQAMRLVKMTPLFGIGRGAFATTFPLVRTGSYTYTYTHPENLVAQWTTEWGVPVTVAGVLVVAAALRLDVLFARSRPPIGAWAAMACLAVHNLVDFSSEVPAVMVALVTCAALVVGGGAGVRASAPRAVPRISPGWATAAMGVVTILALALGVSTIGRTYEDDGVSLRRRVTVTPGDGDAFRVAVRNVILRHPAEPYFPYLGALRAFIVRDESPLPWLAATLNRAPFTYAPAHLLLARTLFGRSPAQARLEYRLAYLQDPEWVPAAVTEGSRLVQSYDDARELAPDPQPLQEQVTEGIAQQIADRLPATAARLEADVERERGPSAAILERHLRAKLDQLEDPGASLCDVDSRSCVRGIDEDLIVLRRLAPGRCSVDVLEARLAHVQGRMARASELLEHAVQSDSDVVSCLPELVALAEHDPTAGVSNEFLDHLARVACEAEQACGATLITLANAEEAKGHVRRALIFAKQAAERSDDDVLLARVASLASAGGLHAEAFQNYQTLALRHPEDARWAAEMTAERNAVFGGAGVVKVPR